MSYANPLLLIGLSAVLIPVVIHLFTQHRAKRMDWGATQFLMQSLVHRNRRMLLEQVLLLVVRCLLPAMLALAMALPFVPPGSRVPWQIVLPTVLLGVGALGTATALGKYRRWRWGIGAMGLLLLLSAAGATLAEQGFGIGLLSKPTGGQDVAIVIDGSDSMRLVVEGVTNFDRAVDEAGAVVRALRPDDAASIIVAGSQSIVATPTPSPRAHDLQRLLSQLRPAGGRMSARDAVATAAATLARGNNITKKVVVITDGQSISWKQDGKVDWPLMKAGLKDLGERPTLLLRRLSLPQRIDNVQIAEIKLASTVVGVDRNLPIAVRVENTGTESVRESFDVELSVDGGEQVLRQPVAAIAAGASETLTFHSRFDRGGIHSLEARANRRDEMPWDDSAARVLQVHERLPVLMIDGNPASRPQDKATWFMELALAPDPSDDATPPAQAKDALSSSVVQQRLKQFSLTTVDLPKVDTLHDLHNFRVVILADVPRLPITVAVELAQFVSDGGGLLVSLGSRCQREFYNHWETAGGLPMLPAQLVERRIADKQHPAARPVLGTFRHPALRVVADAAQSDLGGASVTAYWRLKPDPADRSVRLCGGLDTNDPLVVERRLGKGAILMTSVSLDSHGSNLPALQSFVPLVHELVSSLMRLPEHGLELELPGTESVELPAEAAGGIAADEPVAVGGRGLKAEYFADLDFGHRVLERVDPTVSFEWNAVPPAEGVPAADFSIRWTGTLVAPTTDKYSFSLEGDRTDLWLDGEHVATSGSAAKSSAKVELTGGRAYAIRVEYSARAKPSKSQVFWQSSNTQRQPIPVECLSSQEAWQHELARSAQVGPSSGLALNAGWTGPDTTRGQAQLYRDGRRLMARLEQVSGTGLYRVDLPRSMRDHFRRLAIGGAVPIAVRGDAEESGLGVLSEDDLAGARDQVHLITAASAGELVQALTESSAGFRLWKYLAVATLVLAIGEIALSRWIATQRRYGSMPQVAFVSVQSDPVAFRTRAMELLHDSGTTRAR